MHPSEKEFRDRARAASMTAEEVWEENDYELVRAWVDHHMRGDWFTSRLFKLWQTADGINREKLHMGFPYEVGVFTWWAYGSRYSPINPK